MTDRHARTTAALALSVALAAAGGFTFGSARAAPPNLADPVAQSIANVQADLDAFKFDTRANLAELNRANLSHCLVVSKVRFVRERSPNPLRRGKHRMPIVLWDTTDAACRATLRANRDSAGAEPVHMVIR